MNLTILHIDEAGRARDVGELDDTTGGWRWIDIALDKTADEHPPAFLDAFALDPLSVHDAFHEFDLPKFEDFGRHALLVLHGVSDADRLTTYEIDCFVTETDLITVHGGVSRAVDALQQSIRAHPELASGGGVEVLARLADGVNRRMLAVVDAFDQHTEDLIDHALKADRHLLKEVAAVRADLAAIRRVVNPQREALDLIRSADSALLTPAARRRFSDVFDVLSRTSSGLDAARSVMSEAVDIYRGAEARSATEISKVLTIYAAILLPLSLVVGFFGMNHTNLPTVNQRWGWVTVTAAMVVIVAVSLGVFVSQGWVRRPSGKAAGATLGRGLAEAARAPAQVATAVFAMSTLPFDSARSRFGRPSNHREID